MENIGPAAVARNNRGQMVPLGTLVNVKESSGPLFVKRYNLSWPRVTGNPLPSTGTRATSSTQWT